jgi:FkbM family methyltransferase
VVDAVPSKPTLRRRALRLIEQAGLTTPLALAGSLLARRATGRRDVALFFDEIWVRRVGDRCYGDRARFDYYVEELADWNRLHALWRDEPEDIWLYAYEPTPGDVIIDVGAGFGNDAVMFSRRVGPSGRVIAIEAHPVSFRKLQKTCKWSKLTNVEAIEVAIDANDGFVEIEGLDDNVGNSIARSGSADGGASDAIHTVKAVQFDNLAAELQLREIALFKMNIEGAERGALQGMTATLGRIRRIVVSCHDFRANAGEGEFFRTKDFVISTLRSVGFQLSFRESDPRPYVRDTVYGVRL